MKFSKLYSLVVRKWEDSKGKSFDLVESNPDWFSLDHLKSIFFFFCETKPKSYWFVENILENCIEILSLIENQLRQHDLFSKSLQTYFEAFKHICDAFRLLIYCIP